MYFLGKGGSHRRPRLAQVARVLLAAGGVAYTDHRYPIGPGFEAPDFKVDKESGALALNLGRAPLLLTPEGDIGQSKSIERYVASLGGLMGKSPVEAARIDMVGEHVRDIKDAQRTKGFSPMSKGKTDEEKAALRGEWFGTDLPSWMARLETCLALMAGEGARHAVGDSISYADVCIWSLIKDAPPTDAKEVAEAAASCPTLQCIAEAVAAHPKVAAWVSTRPQSMF